MEHITEEERRRRMALHFGAVQAQRFEKRERPTVPELDPVSLNVLIKAATEVGIFLLAVYETLGLHAAEGKRALDDLLARGFIRLHRIVRKGRGGQPTVIEVLPTGVEELRKRGISPAEKKIKRGGFKHDVYGRLIERWAKAPGYRCSFERTLGSKAFDVVVEDDQGNLLGLEICLTGSVEWTAGQLLKAAEVPGVQRIVAAFERKEFMDGVMKKIGAIDALGLMRKKIEGKLLADYVS